jgi:hypothetical protein
MVPVGINGLVILIFAAMLEQRGRDSAAAQKIFWRAAIAHVKQRSAAHDIEPHALVWRSQASSDGQLARGSSGAHERSPTARRHSSIASKANTNPTT